VVRQRRRDAQRGLCPPVDPGGPILVVCLVAVGVMIIGAFDPLLVTAEPPAKRRGYVLSHINGRDGAPRRVAARREPGA
jgi:hypothetical protein